MVLGDVWRRWVVDTFGVRRAGWHHRGVPATMPSHALAAPEGRSACCSSAICWSERGLRPAARLRQPFRPSRDIILTMAGGGPVDTYRALAAELGSATGSGSPAGSARTLPAADG